MTANEIIDLIAASYDRSRNYWQHEASERMDALEIVHALCGADLCTDDEVGPKSLEARILRRVEAYYDQFDGSISSSDLAEEIALELGLVVQDEWSGEMRVAA